jgi:hypothetical protein
MFRYGAEILPYHDFDLETALSELAKMGFREVNLWSSAAPLAHHINPGDDTKKIRALFFLNLIFKILLTSLHI